MALDRDHLLKQLTVDEGFRPYIYDDATGGRIIAGKVLQGKATLAVGWCPQTNPCPEELGQIILAYFSDDINKTLFLAAPWVEQLPGKCTNALCDMAYQLGVTGLLGFKQFMDFMQQGKYQEASDDLETTLWYKQSGNRAKRIQADILTGL